MVVEDGRLIFEEAIREDINFLSEFYEEKLNEFLRMANITNKPLPKDVLINLGCATEKGKKIYFNNAGLLFFSKNQIRFNRNAYITCALFKGKIQVDVLDRKDFDGNLLEQFEDSIKFIQKNTRLAYEIKGLYRKEIPEYPIEAIREGVLNAIIHRDYLIKGGNIYLYIFDDRIEITSPGSFPKGMHKEDIGKKAVRRK